MPYNTTFHKNIFFGLNIFTLLMFFLFLNYYTINISEETLFQNQLPSKPEKPSNNEKEKSVKKQFLKKAIEISEKIENERAQASAFIKIGEVLQKQGDIKEATLFIEKVLKITRKQENANSSFRVEALLQISNFFLQKGDLEQVNSLCEEILKIDIKEITHFSLGSPIPTMFLREKKLDMYLNVGQLLFKSDKTKAFSIFKEGLNFFAEDMEAPMWRSLNLLHFLQKNATQEEIFPFLKTLSKLIEEDKYNGRRCMDFITLAEGWRYLGNQKEANLLFEKAVENAEKRRDYSLFLRLGKSLLKNGDNEKAEKLIKYAFEIASEKKDNSYKLLAFGEVYFLMGRNEEALSFLKKAEFLAEKKFKKKTDDDFLFIFFSIRSILLKFNYKEEANSVLENALKVAKNGDSIGGLFYEEIIKATYHDNREQADFLCYKLLHAIEKWKDNRNKAMKFLRIGTIKASNGDIEEAEILFGRALELAQKIEEKQDRDFTFSYIAREILQSVNE